MIIPHQELPPETLTAIIEGFVLQEGTEYGQEETSLADKIEQVKQQLQQGSVVLVYSELHENVNILSKEHFQENLIKDQ
jgi:uncharacterized protein YheU (UPF0270 family)